LWIRVVSMPCTELFDASSAAYQRSVLIPGSPIMSIEASSVEGWLKYAHAPYGIPADMYGLSAPAEKIYAYFGLTVPNLVKSAKEVITFYTKAAGEQPTAPALLDYPRFPRPAPVH
jgi:transketolase